MAYNLKHTGAEIDEQIDRVIDGSAFAEELAKRGYIFKGVADNDTVPDNTPMSFYLTYGVGKYSNFFGSGSTNLAKGLYAFVYDGTHWEYRIISTDIIYEAELEATLARYATKENLSTELNSLEERVNTRMDEGDAAVSQRMTAIVSEVKENVLQTLSDTEREIYKEVDKKANTNEYYPAMAVGIADNLRGRGEAIDTRFTYRPSAGAGNSIADEGVATMTRLKGNTIVWNQKIRNTIATVDSAIGWRVRQGADNAEIIGDSIRFNFVSGVSANVLISQEVNFVKGHKYSITIKWLLNGELDEYSRAFRIRTSNDIYASQVVDFISDVIKTPTLSGVASVFFTPTNNAKYITIDPRKFTNNIGQYAEICVKITDVTKMFDSGNEPTTIEELYERIPTGIDVNAYNEGELIPVNTESIETVGFNLFDEAKVFSEAGMTLTNDGWQGEVKKLYRTLWTNDFGYNGQICVYMKSSVVSGSPAFRVRFHYTDGTNSDTYFQLGATDSPKEGFAVSDNGKVVDYIRGHYGDTGDILIKKICINLSHSGVENGRYEKYVKSVIELPEIAQCFPDGFKSAGAAFDEINETQAIKRVGVVDLGELNWVYGNPFGGTKPLFYTTALDRILNIKDVTDVLSIANTRCAEYTATSANILTNTSIDKAIAVYKLSGNKCAFVADTSYTDVETFKNAMSGVKLYFELAELEVIELQQRAKNLNYAVWDWGTERAVSSKPSAPFRADTIYGFNAVDTIRMNKADIEKLLQRVAELEARIPSAEAPVTEE